MKHLSDPQLLGELQALKNRECKTTLTILRYLNELERRKLFLRLGYSSLFAFAAQRLRYSESAAGRRIQAARCIRKYPEVQGLLLRNEVNLSTIAAVSGILNDKNKDEFLARIRHKSQRQVEAIVATAKPAARVRDRVKPVLVPVPVSAAPGLDAQNCRPAGSTAEPSERALGATLFRQEEGRSGEAGRAGESRESRESHESRETGGRGSETASVPQGTDHSRSGSETATASGTAAPVEQHFKVQFAARREFMQKFEEARALLSGRFPKGAPFAAVFEAALDALLDKKSPARRKARRERDARQRAAREAQRAAQRLIRPAHEGRGRGRGRERVGRLHIPIAVRDAVFARDGGRCTFVATGGKRCNSSHDVEIDHEQPVARGGTNAIDNLRLLCARHNMLEAERVYGTKNVQRFMDAAKSAVVPTGAVQNTVWRGHRPGHRRGRWRRRVGLASAPA